MCIYLCMCKNCTLLFFPVLSLLSALDVFCWFFSRSSTSLILTFDSHLDVHNFLWKYVVLLKIIELLACLSIICLHEWWIAARVSFSLRSKNFTHRLSLDIFSHTQYIKYSKLCSIWVNILNIMRVIFTPFRAVVFIFQ